MWYLARERLSSQFICNIDVVAIVLGKSNERLTQTKQKKKRNSRRLPCAVRRYQDHSLCLSLHAPCTRYVHIFIFTIYLFDSITVVCRCARLQRETSASSSFAFGWCAAKETAAARDGCLLFHCRAHNVHTTTAALAATLSTVDDGRMCIRRNSFAKYLTVFLLYQSPKPSRGGVAQEWPNVRLPRLLYDANRWANGHDGHPIYLPSAISLSSLLARFESTRNSHRQPTCACVCALDPSAFRLIVICRSARAHIVFNSRVNHFAYDRHVLPWLLSQMANSEWCCVDWAVVAQNCFSQ